ncbi:MAG: hypothetical protein WDO73_28155 [Ignavibacteriota bacterium]
MANKKDNDIPSRRSILGAAAAALSAASALPTLAFAQSSTLIKKGEADHSADNPGPTNKRSSE